MFQTLGSAPFAGLMQVSEFQRQHASEARDSSTGCTRLSALDPTLLQDLMRFDRGPTSAEGLDLLEVMAASLRHGRALLLHLHLGYRVFPLAVWPRERELLAPVALERLLALKLPDMRVLRVEPAPPELADPKRAEALEPPLRHRASLNPLLWELALRGTREALLPEIDGAVAYRVAPGTDFGDLELEGSLADGVARLKHRTTLLRDMARWPGFDLGRATRMLNGLYLQAALMISRAHPGAVGA